MSVDLAPFIKWGGYTSKNPQIPDILSLEVLDTETFETEFSTNVHVMQKLASDSWEERVLPLKSHESNNTMLLQMWNKAKRQGKVVTGAKLSIHTYVGLSKNNRPIRRFELVF